MTRNIKPPGEAAPAVKVTARKAGTSVTPAARPERPQPFRAPRPIGSFIPALTRKAFEKYGFSAVALITDWPEIVGRDLAAYTAPEKVKWPRPSETALDDQHARRGAVLHLRVEGAHALDIEYRRQEVADRINAYFGYRAITEVRILQAPLSRKPEPQKTRIEPRDRVALPKIADEGLRAALERLGSGMTARNRQIKKETEKP